VKEFVEELPEETRNRLVRLIEHIADQGKPRSEQKFRHEEKGIFAIKQGQVRIYCFFDDDWGILLTHGTIKKKNKADPEDLKRAKRLRNAYRKAKRH
jgi:mRNA-degrading endonuclease RelE of RelBE toxin-antitoxin system